MHLQMLKRIVFKMIIGIERVEYYVLGHIRGRDSGLGIREPKVQNIIPDPNGFPHPFEKINFVENKRIHVRSDLLSAISL